MVWLIGGLDPSGGAGVLRDLWTLRATAPAARAGVVVSAWTWQGQGRGAARAEARPLGRALGELARLPRPAAIKLGLVPASWCAAGLAEELQGLAEGAPIVLDPVLRASDGGDLGATVSGLRRLLAVATLVTPNLAEAAALAGCRPDELEENAAEIDERLHATVPTGTGLTGLTWLTWLTWLIKGGHGGDPAEVVDRLGSAAGWRELRRPRIPGPDPRGTGCALATAIAGGLARGLELAVAVEAAIAWLDGARQRWRRGRDGRPHLPIASPGDPESARTTGRTTARTTGSSPGSPRG